MGYIPTPPPLPDFFHNVSAIALSSSAFDVWLGRIDDLLANGDPVMLKVVRCPQCGAPLDNAHECVYCGSRFEVYGFPQRDAAGFQMHGKVRVL